jgi:hypothetical protein
VLDVCAALVIPRLLFPDLFVEVSGMFLGDRSFIRVGSSFFLFSLFLVVHFLLYCFCGQETNFPLTSPESECECPAEEFDRNCIRVEQELYIMLGVGVVAGLVLTFVLYQIMLQFRRTVYRVDTFEITRERHVTFPGCT